MIDKKIKLVSIKTEESEFTEEDLEKAPDGFFVEIDVVDVLDHTDRSNALGFICSKVRRNGRLRLSGIDGLDLCRNTFYGAIPLDVASQYFKPLTQLNSIVSLKEYFLNNQEWTVGFTGLKDGRYLVEVTRS